jgi:hypothetical protein
VRSADSDFAREIAEKNHVEACSQGHKLHATAGFQLFRLGAEPHQAVGASQCGQIGRTVPGEDFDGRKRVNGWSDA